VPISNPVNLQLDWNFRYMNMQQHTGQHILSSVLYKLFNFETVSVHLGRENTLIELDTKEITSKQIAHAEMTCHKIIRDSIEIKEIWPEKSEISKYTLRREIKINSKNIRLIKIGDLDCTGCGGTHVNSTAEVGLIKIIGFEKIRGRIRIQAKIGESAYNYFKELHDVFSELVNQFSSGLGELAENISNLAQSNKSLKRTLKKRTTLWLELSAKDLITESVCGIFFFDDLQMDEGLLFSSLWTERHKKCCFVVIGNGQFRKMIFRVLPDKRWKANEIINDIKEKIFFKGGGNEQFVQGEIDFKNKNNKEFKLFLQKVFENLIKQ